MMAAQAVIETERLRLRRLVEADVPALFAMFNDRRVMRYYPGLLSMDATRTWLAWQLRNYTDHGHGLWAVEIAQSGEFAGQIGLLHQDVEGIDEVEIGYLLCSAYWHRGYATEAARACRDYGFNVLGRDRLISLIRPENEPSMRVAERVGLQRERLVERKGYDHWVYAIARPLHG